MQIARKKIVSENRYGMDYKKIHDQLIARAKNRILKGYKEKHHIIPRCLGGSDDIDNLVNLTAREHFIIHKLLYMIYPNNNKLFYAYRMMAMQPTNVKTERAYSISNYEYERLRIEHAYRVSLDKKGKKYGTGMLGISHTKLSKEKIRTANLGKVISTETKQKMRDAQLGKTKKRWSKIYKEVTTGKVGHLSDLCEYFNIKPHCITDNITRPNPRKPDGLKFILVG
jgi:hypothetical protein